MKPKDCDSHYKGKRFLINQPLIHGINGSTIVTLELADFLQKNGAKVDIFTLTLQEPAKTLFLDRGLNVAAVQNNPDYRLEDYDYIWVHSQVLPPSIIDDLGKGHKTYPAFVFLHMSSMDWIPDEHPYIHLLEERLSSISLYICEEVRESNLGYFYAEPPYDYFRNPSPDEFLQFNAKYPKDGLKRMLLVSNYAPNELMEACKIIANDGIVVDTLGEGCAKYELLSPNILQRYDGVVTIAKTVQYCLVSNTPVYIYGKFGGAGWLNNKNYSKAVQTNFCGSEGFPKKSAREIATEILTGFEDGKTFQDDHLEEFRKEFSLKECLPNILAKAKPKVLKVFEPQYVEMLKSAAYFERIRFEEWSNVWRLTNELREIRSSKAYKAVSLITKIRQKHNSKRKA